ncbi:YbaB/EbfC family nucleoid-associated protein [Nocardia sp. NPDC051832]|uniref:YbaB/EbfC family nucleoid-associated protein n=1 Tax=Nocardia sp. NPDC051832 TaxID=3155673 RepID=UPI00344A6A16
MFAGMREQIQALGAAQRERAELIITGTAAGSRVAVTVNADGEILDVRIEPAASGMSYRQLSVAVTEAAKSAQQQAAQRNAEIFAPFLGAAGRKRKDFADVLADFDEIADMIPGPQPVAVKAPTTEDSTAEVDGTAEGFEETRHRRPGGATDLSW